jgi:oligopeptide/dipeptide ABC transporter ATP-binding protein
MTELMEVRHASKIFGGKTITGKQKQGTVALNDFTMTVHESPPTITAVVGESGSGKTTLARLMLGLTSPTSGQVLYRGTDVQKLSKDVRLAFLRDVQTIMQDPYEVYNPFYKVDHVLKVPIEKFKLAKNQAQTQILMEEALSAVGLRPEDTLGRHPHQLSGGQRQRIMVARALLIRPRLIIADEPVSMVDASLRATILEGLRRLHDDFGISMLYITHDLTTAYQISSNIIVLYRGDVSEVGDVDLVVRAPLHPYTQLLIESIPVIDLSQTWKKEKLDDETQSVSSVPAQGCRFANRCPHVMDICRQQAPPLFRTDEGRAVSCYLYRDNPVLGERGLDEVLEVTQGNVASAAD